MTVCIAALSGAQDDPRVVVAADRMVTYPNFLEFEHPGSKIVQLSEHAIVMVAGDTLMGMRLARDAVTGLSGSSAIDIASIAKVLAELYAELRMARAEQFFVRSRGLTLDSLYANHANLNGQVAMMIDNQLVEFNLGVELLLAGVDGTGGHIHTSANPGGGNQNHDPISYAAIGSGAVHVLPSMAGFGHGAKSTYGQTLFHVYASKCRAEVAPGVGGNTEMVVVGKDGVGRLTSDEMDELGSIYDEFVSKTNVELQKQLAGFEPEGEKDEANGSTSD